jgi:hypothetical protein
MKDSPARTKVALNLRGRAWEGKNRTGQLWQVLVVAGFSLTLPELEDILHSSIFEHPECRGFRSPSLDFFIYLPFANVVAQLRL